MSKRSTVWLCIVVIIATMFYGLTPMIAEQDSVYRTYAPLIEVDALIQREFVHPLRGSRLVDGAIRGMMLELDPYSGYVAPGEMPAFRRSNTGRYIGIGVEIGMLDESITVIAPLEHGPAMRAGVQAGDTILAVNGRSTEDLSVFDVEGLLAGDPHSTVALRLRRAGGDSLDLNVVRAQVQRRAVKGFGRRADGSWSYFVDPDGRIAYVRVAQFSKGMIDDFDAVLDTLDAQHVRALILDLRFNPGGLLPQGIAMAERFLESGTILTTVSRRQAVRTYTTGGGGTFAPIRLAILVNAGSASSSEIVAGALQDHGRAIIVGERTFGKGSVQDFIQIQDGRAGVRLTVAYYQLPSGRMIHRTRANAHTDDWGVMPDIHVPLTPDERRAILQSRSAVDLSAVGGSGSPTPTHLPRSDLLIDRQFRAALDVLTSGSVG